jgi:hypothetical protein
MNWNGPSATSLLIVASWSSDGGDVLGRAEGDMLGDRRVIVAVAFEYKLRLWAVGMAVVDVEGKNRCGWSWVSDGARTALVCGVSRCDIEVSRCI